MLGVLLNFPTRNNGYSLARQNFEMSKTFVFQVRHLRLLCLHQYHRPI